ncbi:hypothetical protein PJP13_29650, partial [Mycobacterium kansasii]
MYPVRDEREGEITDGFKEYRANIKPHGQKRSSGRPKKAKNSLAWRITENSKVWAIQTNRA